MTSKSVLILGARSDIGKAVATKFASLGFSIQLAARYANNLEAERADIELRYNVPVTLHEFDALAISGCKKFIAGLPEMPHIVICAVGLLGRHVDNIGQVEIGCDVLRANFVGPACALASLANEFEQRGSGVLVGISSVAGERGRGSNYVYGAAKAGFTAFLSGLRNRLARHGVHVVTVLPGFVSTRMTEGMHLPRLLTVKPEYVAQVIAKAVYRKSNVVYVSFLWWPIMVVIKSIPESVFKRLNM